MASAIQIRVDDKLKRNAFAVMSEEELMERLSAVREHSALGRQKEANAVASDMRSKHGL